MTQKGIADNISIHLSHVPRAVKHLEAAGLVLELRAHIQPQEDPQSSSTAVTRKLKAYFLTDNGINLAKSLRSKLGEQKITFMNLKGQPKKLKLSELNNSLQESERANILNLYNFIISEGNGEVFYCRKWKDRLGSFEKNRGTKEFSILYPKILDNIPKFGVFFGRDQELELLKSSIDSDKYKLVIISGDKGIGKTALVSKVIEKYTSTTNIFWCETGDSQIIQYISNELSKLLSLANKRTLKNYLTKLKDAEIDNSKLINILRQDLHDVTTILAIDGVRASLKKTRDLINFAGFLKSLLENITALKIVITCRNIEPLIPVLNSKIGAEHIRIIELKGLDKRSSKKILAQSGSRLSNPEFEGIYHHTGGNPSYLELIGAIKLAQPKDQEKYTPEERALLKYLKVVEKLGN